ncbi:MAG: RNA polymerase sigma factor [Clostridiales bacterium]|nr:RNA polymerase sigma factor [Clostridiales bacterium]
MDYEEAVRQNLDVVYRAALACCKNPADAEDVVQSTFEKLLRTDTAFTDADHLRRWLIRVAVNEGRNLWKSFWRRNVSSLEGLELEPAAPEGGQPVLLEAVLSLPVEYRTVLHLYYYEGYSTREIAHLLHLTEANVRTRLKRGRCKLRQQLTKEESE